MAEFLRADVETPKRGVAMMLMVISSVAISFGGLIVRSMQTVDPWQIGFYRSGAFIVAVLILIILQYRQTALAQIGKTGRAGLIAGALLAFAGIAFLQALTSTTVANTLFVLSSIPFITAALAWLILKEQLERTTIITMVVASAGVCIMVMDGIGLGAVYGNVMALCTALAFASFAIVVRRNRQVDMLPALLVSGGIMLVISLVLRWDQLNISLMDVLLCFFWGGALAGLANAMFIVASRHLVAAELTLFMLLEFSLGPVWVWLFAGETPTVLTIAGGCLVIGSVCLRALYELRKTSTKLRRGRPSPM